MHESIYDILCTVVTVTGTIVVAYITTKGRKESKSSLLSEETIEVTAPDGTKTKTLKKRYG